jgi:hypothetical protein
VARPVSRGNAGDPGRLAEGVDEPRRRRLGYGCSVRQPEEMTPMMTMPKRADYASDDEYFAALDEYYAAELYADMIPVAA